MFVAIGDGKLSDLKVTGYQGEVAGELVTISKITQYGVATDGIVWIDYPDMSLYGWYITDWESQFDYCGDNPLTTGESLKIVFQAEAVGWSILNSGEVSLYGVAVTLVQGPQYLATAVPRASKMGEIILSGYQGEVAGELVTISKITQYGVATDGIVWIDYPDMSLYGWYLTDWETQFDDCSDIDLAMGQGLKVVAQAEAAGWTLTFPPAVPEEK